jgi:hypothetical protein
MSRFMPIGDFKVVYVDGTTEECKSNFLGLVEIERRWPNEENAPGVTATAIAVFYYLGCPGQDFDKWLAKVHNIEPADKQDAEVELEDVPTEPAAGAA